MMKRKKIITIIGIVSFISAALPFGLLVTLIGAIVGEDEDGANTAEASTVIVEDIGIYESSVEAYREIIKKYCVEYENEKSKKVCGGLGNYVNAVLALMTIESHGSGTDPMQASEGAYNTKYSKEPNAIKDPDYSCQCGVQEFRDAIVMAKVSSPTDYDRLGVAIQGYNFGMTRWLEWINDHGGKYTVELATKYSNDKMPSHAKGTPTHAKKFLDTYKSAITSNSGKGQINIDTSNIEDILKLKDAGAWLLVTNNQYKSKPTFFQMNSVQTGKLCTTISVKVWKFKSSKGTKLKSVTINVVVNKALSEYYKSFFNDCYNEKIVMETVGCYCHRANANNSSSLSTHSFGVALDINENYNPNGVNPPTTSQWEKLSKRKQQLTWYSGSPIVSIAKKYTMQWGGQFSHTKDAMHFAFVGDGTRS